MILSKEYGPIVTQQFLVTKEDLISSTVVDDQGDNCHDIVHVDTQVSQGKLICYNCKSWVYQQCVIPFQVNTVFRQDKNLEKGNIIDSLKTTFQ